MAGILALLIPILALSIPIVAIFSNSAIGKALADRIRAKSSADPAQLEQIRMLELRIRQLEQSSMNQSEEMERLEQNYHFISRLLEDSGKNRS